MTNVLLMSGIPGSGKSFEVERRMCGSVNRPMLGATHCLNARPNNILLSADHYFARRGNQALLDKLSDAHGECLREYLHAIQTNDMQPDQIVVDNTNCSNPELAPYIAIAQAYCLKVEVITMVVNVLDISKACARNLHNVPFNTVSRMWHSLNSSVAPPYWNNVLWTNIPAVFLEHAT